MEAGLFPRSLDRFAARFEYCLISYKISRNHTQYLPVTLASSASGSG